MADASSTTEPRPTSINCPRNISHWVALLTFLGIFPTGVLSGSTVPHHRSALPSFRHCRNVGRYPDAGSSFNALYIKFNQRLKSGLTVMSSYQFSKALDNASENQG